MKIVHRRVPWNYRTIAASMSPYNQINQEKTKYMIVERKNSLKTNKIEHFKIKNYKF